MPDKKIFIVEDESIVAMTLEDTLVQLGYEVAGTAANGQDAIRMIGQTHPDLILMDIRIEGEMDGIETAGKVTELYNIPVVYLTAHADEKTLERAMTTQPHGYLLKPFRTRELYSTIEIALYKHRLIAKSPGAAAPAGDTASVPGAAPREHREKPTTVTLEHAVLDAIDPAVFVVNRELKIVYFNPSCEALFARLGFAGPVAGRTITDAAPPSFAGPAREYTGIFETGRRGLARVPCTASGEQVVCTLVKIPLTQAGTVAYVAGIVTDSTRENLLDERAKAVCSGCEGILSRLGEITAVASGKEDPEMKKIEQTVGEIVIAITKLDSRLPDPGQRQA